MDRRLIAALLACSPLVAQDGFRSLRAGLDAGGKHFFVADDELWVVEADKARPVKEIRPGPEGAQIGRLSALGDRVVFFADDGAAGRQLWASDGTAKGTVALSKFDVGDRVGSAHGEIVSGFFFCQSKQTYERTLWRTDGTAAGTKPVRKFPALSEPAFIPNYFLTAVPSGRVVFRMKESNDAKACLWGSDGTAAGTVQLANVWPSASAEKHSMPSFRTLGKRLAFAVGDKAKVLWVTDGTKAGTKQLGGGAVGKIGGPPPTAKERRLARVQFMTYCATCHGKKGKGDGPAGLALNPKPRNWSDPKWQASVTDQHILKIIRDGGAKHGLSPMMAPNPQYQKNQQVLKALVELVRNCKAKKRP